MSISFSSSKLSIWSLEDDKEVLNILFLDSCKVELFTWSFKSKLKLGPWRGVESWTTIGSSSKVTS